MLGSRKYPQSRYLFGLPVFRMLPVHHPPAILILRSIAAARRSNGTDSVLRRSYVESNIILEFVGQIAYVGSTTDMITGCGYCHCTSGHGEQGWDIPPPESGGLAQTGNLRSRLACQIRRHAMTDPSFFSSLFVKAQHYTQDEKSEGGGVKLGTPPPDCKTGKVFSTLRFW